jgi:hypothetical protein
MPKRYPPEFRRKVLVDRSCPPYRPCWPRRRHRRRRSPAPPWPRCRPRCLATPSSPTDPLPTRDRRARVVFAGCMSGVIPPSDGSPGPQLRGTAHQATALPVGQGQPSAAQRARCGDVTGPGSDPRVGVRAGSFVAEQRDRQRGGEQRPPGSGAATRTPACHRDRGPRAWHRLDAGCGEGADAHWWPLVVDEARACSPISDRNTTRRYIRQRRIGSRATTCQAPSPPTSNNANRVNR